MSVATEIERLQGAKEDIKDAIEAKGVTVPSSAKIDDYADYVSQISGGGKFKPHVLYYLPSASTTQIGVQNILSDLENMDTSLVENFYQTFSQFNINDDVSNIKISLKMDSATDARYMFQSAHVDFIDLKNETLPNYEKSIQSMFDECTAKRIDMRSFIGEKIPKLTASWRAWRNAKFLEELDLDSCEFSKYANSSNIFSSTGASLPEGTYTKVYVKDATEQAWILGLGTQHRPAGWTTANVIIAGSADDHRND